GRRPDRPRRGPHRPRPRAGAATGVTLSYGPKENVMQSGGASVSRPSGIAGLIRPDLSAHAAYEPIEPVEVLAERLGVPAERIVKLDGNENLYGPSPRVREALAAHDGLHIYPDPDQRAVREALARYVGAPPENIVAGAGSDELIDLVARALLSPGG